MSRVKTAKTQVKTGYVDGFVLTVPTKHLAAYRKMAKKARNIWLEHGALDYYESVGDDMKSEMGIPFPELTAARRAETVVFAWITYKSRAQRDRVNAQVMKDERLMKFMNEEVCKSMRMSYGGFKIIVGK